MPLIIPSNSISAGGYEVDNSLRFNDGSSDYLSRTPASASNRKTFTISVWFKRGQLGSQDRIFDASTGATTQAGLIFTSGDGIQFYAGSGQINVTTNRLFRDVSAWSNIIVAVDTTQATSSDRVKLYVNGTQETSLATSTYPSQNYDTLFNSTVEHTWSKRWDADQYFDGYMAECVFIDGQALDPTSFGEFDEDSGIWKPINVSGLTFGTNGFYLPFENSAALGQDDSGNGNNFTVNNLTSIDQTTDTPTNNFATFNPLASGSTMVFSEGNLKVTDNGTSHTSNHGIFVSSIGVDRGKWYAEFKFDDSDCIVGITSTSNENVEGPYWLGSRSGEYGLDSNGTPTIWNNFSGTTYGSGSTSSGDIVSVAMDLDNNKLYFAKNGVWYNSGNPAAGTNGHSIASDEYYFAGGHGSLSQLFANFGNPPFSISSGNSDADGYGNFEYSVPSGYYSLNSKNLAEYG
jgi:hypothetical protein